MKRLLLILTLSFWHVYLYGQTAAILSQPQSITVNNASTAMFSVQATNATNYQWQFDNVNILNATNSTLVIDDVITNQAGTYTVVINHSVTSSNAILTLVPGTIIRFQFTGLRGQGTNIVDVQLFDHDKPATVENFLHYIRSGAFTNMFFERCIPNFVLQGGGNDATDQTNQIPPIIGYDINTQFTASTDENPPFVGQLDSEYGVGPLIPNTFGTLAMALGAGNPNSAHSAFFFNLVDNSAGLDGQEGNFTVFGRILDGTNVLQYFNTLSNNAGVITNAAFEDLAGAGTNAIFPNLPVNYLGASAPGNSNLVFANIQLPTNAPVDTNPPVVAITTASNYPVTNITGTAADDVAVANVYAQLIPLPAADGTYPGEQQLFATGTTNWSLPSLDPGNYTLTVQSQDGAGNVSTPETESVIVTTIQTNGEGLVFYNGQNAVGYPFAQGISTYLLAEAPNPGWVFLNWMQGDEIWVGSYFYYADYPAIVGFPPYATATFITNALPNSLDVINPAANAAIASNGVFITGTLSNIVNFPVTMTAQIYAAANYSTVGSALSTNLTSSGSWTLPVSNTLSNGGYAVQVIVTDSQNQSTIVTRDFFVGATNPFLLATNLVLDVQGNGVVTGVTNGEPIESGELLYATAIPDAGYSFFLWNDNGAIISTNASVSVEVVDSLALTAVFVPTPVITLTNEGNGMVSGVTNGESVPPYTVLTVTAAPDYGYILSGWETNGVFASTQTTLTIEVVSNLTLTAVFIPAPQLTVNIQGRGTVAGVTNGEFFPTPTNLTATAVPAAGYTFFLWEVNGISASTSNVLSFGISSNLSLTAIFVPTNEPVDAAFVMPGPVIGKVPFYIAAAVSNDRPMTVMLQLLENGTPLLEAPVILQTAGNWEEPSQALPAGNFEIVASLQDANSNGFVISNNFTVQYSSPLTIATVGSGTVPGATNGQQQPLGVNFQITAQPTPGNVFLSWNDGSQVYNNASQTFMMSYGLELTATFVPSNTAKGISFTYPAPKAILNTNSFEIKGKTTPAFRGVTVTCQLFSTNGGAAVTPPLTTTSSSTWEVLATNIPGGNYILVAIAGAGSESTVIYEDFSVSGFAAAQGTYTGLFICTNGLVNATNSGFITFTVNANGLFSGRISFPAFPSVPIYSYPFQNINNVTGYSEFGLTKFFSNPWNANVFLNLAIGAEAGNGVVSGGNWISELTFYRAQKALSAGTVPAVGKYVLSLPLTTQTSTNLTNVLLTNLVSTNATSTNGYATVNVSKNGILTVAGALPDATTFAESTRVSSNGVWPLYAVPSGTRGQAALLGWETNLPGGAVSGQLFWYKAAGLGSYDTAGVGLLTNCVINTSGTNYSAPIAGTTYSIVLQGGSLTTSLTNILSVQGRGQFTVTAGAQDKLKLALSAVGVLTGSMQDPASGLVLHLKGAFLSPSEGGSGFISCPDGEIGTFSVQLQAP